MEWFNNREIAIAVWTLVFVVFILSNKEVRKALFGLRSILTMRIIVVALGLIIGVKRVERALEDQLLMRFRSQHGPERQRGVFRSRGSRKLAQLFCNGVCIICGCLDCTYSTNPGCFPKSGNESGISSAASTSAFGNSETINKRADGV